MLEKLQHIVIKVSEATDLDVAMAAIVSMVKAAMKVDQCSIFLVDPDDNHLLLTASDGLDPGAIGNVRLSPGEGLAGLVAKQQRPTTVANASEHPSYRYFPITGEARYRAFLGVPIVHLRNVVGVLVVQSMGDYQFSDEDVAFLVTISAQLAGVVHGAALGEHIRSAKMNERQSRIQGVASAPGVAVGTPVLPSPLADITQVEDKSEVDIEYEESEFLRAIAGVTSELLDSGERLRTILPEDTLDLFDAYIQLTNDEMMVNKTVDRIRGGQWAPAALRDTVKELTSLFEEMEDELLRSRSEDIRAVGRRILLQLHPEARRASEYPDSCILVGKEVSIARISDVPVQKLAGIVCFEGSALSHTAIMAKSLGIPAVMGLGRLPLKSFTSDLIVVDGYQGRVYQNPLPAVLAEFRRLEQEEVELRSRLRNDSSLPSITLDGDEITVLANVAMQSDIEPALKSGAAGVGLYRTEFPFMVRESFPVEDEQVNIYRKVLEAFAPKPVVIRTLDIGGDKPLPYFTLEDRNPSLGWRGIRVSLNHPEIFVTQIRALFRANIGTGNLKIMLPMVSTVAEVDEVQALIDQSRDDLASEGINVGMPPLGAMIEVPSMLFQIPELAKRVDFLSVGSNDLTQYLMAAARDNPNVSDLYDQLQPAVLRAIRDVVSDIHAADKEVTICGELAGDPIGILLTMGMGIDTISVSTAASARIKWVIRSFSRDVAKTLLENALRKRNAQEVRRLVQDAIEKAGLGGLVHAGK